MLFLLSRSQFKRDPLLLKPGFKGHNVECWLNSHKSIDLFLVRFISSSLSIFIILVWFEINLKDTVLRSLIS